MLRILTALWTKEWLALSRDVHGLAVLFLMPAAFIVIMSLALSDAFKEGARVTDFAVLGSPKLGERLAGEGFRAVPAPADERHAREQLRRGGIGLVVLVPAQYDGTGPVTVLADPALDALQLLAFRERLLGAALGIDLKRATNVSVEVIGSPRPARPSSVQQNVPAWLIFGMFFVVLPISALFIVERRDGTAARLRSQQVAFSLLLVGKIGPFFVINLLQTILMLAAGLTLVPWLGGEALSLPARWDLLAAVAACTSLAAIAWGLLVAVCARTLEQATVIGGVGNILAAALGGIMVPRFVMPATMQAVASLSPMAWALDGFHAVLLRQGSGSDIALPCAKLVALAAVLFAAAVWLQRRRG
ncbi:MAG: ABC transporter permease [Betaproteobacteria bacterium]|nr:MAG: ABC transporter permease [Betaproteobacteria bacterium]